MVSRRSCSGALSALAKQGLKALAASKQADKKWIGFICGFGYLEALRVRLSFE